MMLLDLPNWLRFAGLRVEEVAGWQTRGHGELRDDRQNVVVVDHHTAGGPNGRAPSLSTCIYGVPGVSGPLANVLQTREESGDDVFMILAAGVSWNAGTGGFAGVSGNVSTVGIECEHTGVIPYPAHRATLTQRFNAAVLKGLGQPDGARSCQHFEWSDTGKPDIGRPMVDAAEWRAKTTQFMVSGQPLEPDTEDFSDMVSLVTQLSVPEQFRPIYALSVQPDGIYRTTLTKRTVDILIKAGQVEFKNGFPHIEPLPDFEFVELKVKA